MQRTVSCATRSSASAARAVAAAASARARSAAVRSMPATEVSAFSRCVAAAAVQGAARACE
jgi:hypothetical protein